jgi:nickel/cobalt exporter
MLNLRSWIATAVFAATLSAHPMGNFSVSHYSRLTLKTTGCELTYVLDLAEIPTLELFQQWQVDGKDSEAVQSKAGSQAASWLENLVIASGGNRIRPVLKSTHAVLMDGAGGMSVLRIEMEGRLPASAAELTLEDRNYANRTGWKEIVVQSGDGVAIVRSTHTARDLSHGLTLYPSDLTISPPQDLQASVSWNVTAPQPPVPMISQATPRAPVAARTVAAVLPPAHSFAESQPSAPGTVTRGDYLSRMLKDKNFGVATILLALLAAFGLGAMHALSPGHGKTIVAAYLVGTRGTLKHALFLGSMVTFTHTVSVFLLGLGVLFFQQYVVPERIIPVLGALSGMSIVVIGAYLLYQRSKSLMDVPAVEAHHDHPHPHAHPHQHDHHHEHAHGPAHEHHHHHGGAVAVAVAVAPVAVAAHSHKHDHHHDDHPHPHSKGFVHTHSHDGHTHSHVVPEGKITMGSLIALGASGGLVPCPSALILLLSAIAVGHTALGLMLLTGFSAGLALVLMAIGGLVIYAKHLLPQTEGTRRHPFFRLVPVFSAVVVIILGLLMTMTAAGWIQPVRFLS